MALAHRLDDPRGDTGSAVAAMARQLQATLSAATADVRPAGDLLTDLRARHDRKLGHPEEQSGSSRSRAWDRRAYDLVHG